MTKLWAGDAMIAGAPAQVRAPAYLGQVLHPSVSAAAYFAENCIHIHSLRGFKPIIITVLGKQLVGLQSDF